jgi:hypothetical protein
MPIIVKRKATGFFKAQDLSCIKQTVQDVHTIISEASILVRAYYIQWFDQNIKTSDYTLKTLEVDEELITYACKVVQGEKEPVFRKESLDNVNKIKLFKELVDTFNSLYDNKPPKIKSDFSLSHILNYSVKNLVTAYVNNIESHFLKYPKRFITCDLMYKGFEKKLAKSYSSTICNHLMYDYPLHEDVHDSNIDWEIYTDLFPTKISSKSRAYDIVVDPWRYLFSMVSINKCLEVGFPEDEIVPKKFKKLYNPLPFHSSFIPMHIRLDTSGISQLLMDKERIKDFKVFHHFRTGSTPNMNTKADMLISFEKLFGRKEESLAESGRYATSIWEFLTNLETCRQYKEIVHTRKTKESSWVFDNAVVTDGVSISFQIEEVSKFGRKMFGRSKKSKDKTKTSEFQYVSDSSMAEINGLKCLSTDPGKDDILAVTDGFKTITYTIGQRKQDTFRKQLSEASLKKRTKGGLSDFESEVLSQYPKKSCEWNTFKRYSVQRNNSREQSTKVYVKDPFFRQAKYTNHVKTKSSEDRFMAKIVKVFKAPQQQKFIDKCHCASCDQEMLSNCQKTVTTGCKGFVIGWGNWGRNPNALKGCAPSPGIGIRRHFSKFFKTRTVNEYLTSQTCPCCGEERGLKSSKLGTFKRHHLLRCTNDNCQSRWWNRNVAGGFNILSRFLGDMITALSVTKPLRSRLPSLCT